MVIDKDEIIRLTEEAGGLWNIDHTRRLLHLIDLIGRSEKHDTDVIWVAAHLHDWGAYAPWAQAGVDHALRSTQVAETFLTERNYPAEFKARVRECIEFHHGGKPDRCIESILLSDADALDFMGIAGMARDFARFPRDLKKGYMASRAHREKLAETILLAATKAIAKERLAEMDRLYADFEAQTFGCF